MKMIISDLSHSIRVKLANQANKLGRDTTGLILEYAIERLVHRLQSDPKLSKNIIFKGGFVMLKSYGSNRTTVDLDTSIHKLSIEEAEKLAQTVIERDHGDGIWMGAIASEKLEHQTEYAGLRLTIRFSLGKPKVEPIRLKKLILDIGIADIITPKPKSATMLSILSESKSIDWTIYPAETIAAEKLHAMVSHGNQNSRYKDIYDLTVILPQCNNTTLRSAIQKTFEHRGTEVPSSFFNFWKTLDKQILQRASGATLPIAGTIPSFQETGRRLEHLLRDLDKK